MSAVDDRCALSCLQTNQAWARLDRLPPAVQSAILFPAGLPTLEDHIRRSQASANHTPIHRLPAELLAEIGLYYILGSKSASSESACVLELVCQHWRDVFRGNQQVWGFHNLRFDLDRVVILRRLFGLLSRAPPETVRIDWLDPDDLHDSFDPSDKGETVRFALEALAPRMARLRELDIDLVGHVPLRTVWGTVALSASSLRTLRIANPPLTPHLGLLKGRYPLLTVLELVDIEIEIKTLSPLRPLLRLLPNLVSLRLERLQNVTLLEEVSEENGGRPIELLHLASIFMDSLHIADEDGHDILRPASLCRLIAPKLRSYTSQDCDWDLHQSCLSQAESSPYDPELVHLDVRLGRLGEDDDLERSGLLDQLRRLPKIAKLCLEGFDTGDVLDALTIRSGQETDAICPLLEHLHLGTPNLCWEGAEEVMKEMILSRKKPNGVPSTFKSLDMDCWRVDAPLYEWLQEHVPDFLPAKRRRPAL